MRAGKREKKVVVPVNKTNKIIRKGKGVRRESKGSGGKHLQLHAQRDY